MKANIIFDNVKAYDVSMFDVKLDQEFKIDLLEVEEGTFIKWFANNDTVLAINVAEDGLSAKLKATSIGKCEIQLQNTDKQIIQSLQVAVYDVIATSLGTKIGTPVLK